MKSINRVLISRVSYGDGKNNNEPLMGVSENGVFRRNNNDKTGCVGNPLFRKSTRIRRIVFDDKQNFHLS